MEVRRRVEEDDVGGLPGSEHPHVVAVKDAKGDSWASTTVMAATDLLWFSGADEVNLPLLAIGAIASGRTFQDLLPATAAHL